MGAGLSYDQKSRWQQLVRHGLVVDQNSLNWWGQRLEGDGVMPDNAITLEALLDDETASSTVQPRPLPSHIFVPDLAERKNRLTSVTSNFPLVSMPV